jgi:WD40 repeat protein
MRRNVYLMMLMILLAALPVLAQESLTQTYVSPDERLTLRYPEGWFVNAEDEIALIFSTQEDIAAGIDDTIPPGEAALALFFSDSEVLADEDIFADGTAAGGIQRLTALLAEDNDDVGAFSVPATLDLGGRSGARSIGSVEDNDVLLLALELDGGVFAMAIGITSAGDLERFEAKMLAILESVNYLPAVTPVQINLDALQLITPENAGQLERLWSATPHLGQAYAVAISPDGQIIASCGADGDIALLDAATGAERRRLTGHSAAVEQVLFSPDGDLLASLSGDGSLRVWDVRSGEQEHLFVYDDPLFYMAYSPGGRWIAYSTYVQNPETLATESSTLWLFDLQAGEEREVTTLEADLFINSMAFDPDSNIVLFSASNDQDPENRLTDVWQWDIERNREISHETMDGNPIDVFFTPAGRPYATMNDIRDPNDVLVWDIEENYVQHRLTGHQDGTYHVVIDGQGALLAAASYDGTVRLWDMETGDELAVLDHDGQAYGIAISQDGRLVATSDDQGSVVLWGIL